MHILLPPSETKRLGGGDVCVFEQLDNDAELRAARQDVRVAAAIVSANEVQAVKALGLGKNNRAEREFNLDLDASPCLPAIERYTGVLYDALDVDSLTSQHRKWITHHVSIQSAMFGMIGADNHIPAYRLSASSRLSPLGRSLKQVWREAHAEIDWQQWQLILDARSGDYAGLAPVTSDNVYTLRVFTRAEDGTVSALNHFNKAAKGDLVRRLALAGANITHASELLQWSQSESIELAIDDEQRFVTLVTQLGAPVAA